MKIQLHGNKKSAELFSAARCVISVFIFAMLPKFENDENMAQRWGQGWPFTSEFGS